ncbi:MAG: ACP phosphodiesterase [Campylobacterota bacterium]|nr:ACP phosphodiesterase [Campylobacterota bacterium]
MNWLAHVLLSSQNIDFQLGNYLADPLKGQVWRDAPQALIEGINTHKAIDSFTDSHPIVSLSKSRLRPKGLLKPVIIDLTYDYFLTQHWDQFCHLDRRSFLDTFNHSGAQRALAFPSQPQELILNLTQNDRLNRYNTLEQLYRGFERMDTRLSPRLPCQRVGKWLLR